jgi:hypothetical protein
VKKEHKEKSPLTHDNLTPSEQQYKEKMPNTTENNNGDSNIPRETKIPEIKFAPDYETGKPIFLHVFNDLANDNNGLVCYDKLQERLIATGKFDAGEAVLMIEHMEKIGEIDHTEQYHMYRIRTAASPSQNIVELAKEIKK